MNEEAKEALRGTRSSMTSSPGVSSPLKVVSAVGEGEQIDTVEENNSKRDGLVRVVPRYIRLRQGFDSSYFIKLTRPPQKGGITIKVNIITKKVDFLKVFPQEITIPETNWHHPYEIQVQCDLITEVRMIQIHHKVYSNFEDRLLPSTVVPSVFVSVLHKETAFLYTFGFGLDGRLGNNSDEDLVKPKALSFKWVQPVEMACGKAHSAIIDVFSNLYMFGNGRYGQLGQGTSHKNVMENSQIPVKVCWNYTPIVVQSVSCGTNHTLCLSMDHQVYAFGDNSHGQLGIGSLRYTNPSSNSTTSRSETTSNPSQQNSSNSSSTRNSKMIPILSSSTPIRLEKVTNIRAVICGGDHSFVICYDDTVLACGSNIAGQLGLGDRKDRFMFEKNPVISKLLAAATTQYPGTLQLATGLYHTLVKCGEDVYSWGNGSNGRLGHGNATCSLLPKRIDALKDLQIKMIACGGAHSGVLTVDSNVLIWGNGEYGQIGDGACKDHKLPTRIRLLEGKKVTQLSFGEWHSMALCQDGTVYAWGFGEQGQLGLDTYKNQALPTIVHDLAGLDATQIRCGGSHTFVVTMEEIQKASIEKEMKAKSIKEKEKELKRLNKERISRQKMPRVSIVGTSQQNAAEENVVSESRRSSTQDITSKKQQRHMHANSSSKKSITTVIANQDTDISEEQEEDEQEVIQAEAWRNHPFVSRLGVRNAWKQELQRLAELKKASSTAISSNLHTKRPQSARNATRSSLSPGMSPRVRKHVLGSSSYSVPSEDRDIRQAVEAATGFYFVTNCSIKENI